MIDKVKSCVVMMILGTSILAGCSSSLPASQNSLPNETKNTQQTPNDPRGSSSDQASSNNMRITIYQASNDAMFLVPEVHLVALPNDHPARTAMELLMSGTSKPELTSVVPVGTKLRHLWIKDQIAYVDFNDKLIKNNHGGSTAEILLVGAIVNTLTEFPEIHRVQILVEGKNIETISGHVDVSEPLSRSEKIIKKP